MTSSRQEAGSYLLYARAAGSLALTHPLMAALDEALGRHDTITLTAPPDAAVEQSWCFPAANDAAHAAELALAILNSSEPQPRWRLWRSDPGTAAEVEIAEHRPS